MFLINRVFVLMKNKNYSKNLKKILKWGKVITQYIHYSMNAGILCEGCSENDSLLTG